MLNGLLPIGTVVLLENSTKRVMVIGLCQRGGSDPDKVWDYCGVIFPEGYLGSDKVVLFNNEQIVQIFAIGYQDIEQLTFLTKADAAIKHLRSADNGNK